MTRRLRTDDWRWLRLLAEQVPCDLCGVPAGETCVNALLGEPLDRAPAHPVRIRKAEAA